MKKELNKTDTVSPEAAKWEAKAVENLAGWQRAQADLANYRKRADEEKQAFIKFAQADLLLQILPVLDNFKRATAHAPQTDGNDRLNNWVIGITAIEKHFDQVLQNNGITELPTNVGDAFDPSLHEAISSEKSDKEPDTILEIIENGYMLNGQLLRPAKVRVATAIY